MKDVRYSKHLNKTKGLDLYKFQEYCRKNAKWIVSIEADYEDTIEFYVDSEGEILGSVDMCQGIWCGCFINLETLVEGLNLEIWNQKKKDFDIAKSMVIENVELFIYKI